MALEFSNLGSRIFTKVKPDFAYNFINEKNIEQVEQDLKKLGIELEIE